MLVKHAEAGAHECEASESGRSRFGTHGVGAPMSTTSVRIAASTAACRPRAVHLSSNTLATSAKLSPEMHGAKGKGELAEWIVRNQPQS